MPGPWPPLLVFAGCLSPDFMASPGHLQQSPSSQCCLHLKPTSFSKGHDLRESLNVTQGQTPKAEVVPVSGTRRVGECQGTLEPTGPHCPCQRFAGGKKVSYRGYFKFMNRNHFPNPRRGSSCVEMLRGWLGSDTAGAVGYRLVSSGIFSVSSGSSLV